MTVDIAVAANATQCFHCGEPVPASEDYGLEIDGAYQHFCCPGCRGVAQLISDSGLADFYRHRTAYSDRPKDDSQPASDAFLVYDDPELARSFSTSGADGKVDARLLIGGITCAACTWLIEHTLRALPGVDDAQVNLATARLDVGFDSDQIKISRIFHSLAALGYKPLPYQEDSRAALYREERHRDLRHLAVAGLGMMQVGMFAIALHAGDLQGIESQYQHYLRWASLPIAAWVVLYSARPFFSTAWRHLRGGALVMDLPIALAIGLAFAASIWATVFNTGQVYFDSVVMFTFFLLLGRFAEKQARRHGLEANSNLEATLPDHVTQLVDRRWLTTPRIQLVEGDIVLVKPGEIVAADGIVISGQSSVKEDTFNGEPTPRDIDVGASVYAGTVNLDGNIQVRAASDYASSRLAALEQIISAPSTGKPELVKFADRVSSFFIAFVLMAAAATWIAWQFIASENAFWISLSVLVISCPCALALATPTALASATNRLRKEGILVQGENALEGLLGCTHLIFDKTGTLTKGELQVATVNLLGPASKDEVLAICTALQQESPHPMSRAFRSLPVTQPPKHVRHHPGAGMEADIAGLTYRMGSAEFCREIAPLPEHPPGGAGTWIAVCREQQMLAWIELHDTLRRESRTVVETAKTTGLQVEMLTGDSSRHGPHLASDLSMDRAQYGQSPQDKLHYVRNLQGVGHKVCMVGDGINDAAVLKRADVSFAVPGAADISKAQADFVLSNGNLLHIPATWDLARKCRRIVRQNFAWALTYNACAIPLAAAGLVAPWLAAIGMSLSSLLVVGNSMRLNATGSKPRAHRA